MPTAVLELADLMARAWRITARSAAVFQILVGAALLLNGPPPDQPFWSAARFLPWWVWAATAIGAGVIALAGRSTWWRLRLAGFYAMAGWYSLWAAIIIIGVAQVGFPYYAVPVYLFLAGLHIFIALVEHRAGRLVDDARAAA